MNGTFEEIGYLSPETEAFRQHVQAAHSAEFAKLESSVRIALEDMRSIDGATGEAYLVGLGYWLRCIESCNVARRRGGTNIA